jgi:diguanylate cyclase (GGDEF)-like protein
MKPLDNRRAIWRLVFGPSLTLAVASAFLLLAVSGIQIPAPGLFMLITIVVSAGFGGAVAGYLSAAIGIGCCLVLLPDPELSFTPDREFRLQGMVVLALLLPFVAGYLRNRVVRRLEAERAMRERAEAANRELLTLRAELVRHAKELERLATTDDLTGLCNRRHFLALAADALRQHAREQRPLALLILDIDLFKSVNDRFGHDAGDAVICHVADVCRGEISGSDILARFGGEEFVLLLPETTGEQAAARAEAMRRRLEATPFEVGGAEVRVTISIGVSEAGADTECIADMMKRADQALYQAKHNGRNRVQHVRRGSPRSNNGAAAAVAA